MKKYGKLIGWMAALALIIGLAALSYGKLKGKLEQDALVEKQTASSPKEAALDENAPEGQAASDENTQKEENVPEEDKTSGRRDAIDVKFYDKDGNPVQLSQFYGKPVVVNFWATWCGYCKQEVPDFQEVYNKYGDKAEFLLINDTDGARETKEKAEAYLEEENLTIPAYYDEDQEAAYVYSIQSLPTTILLDKEGKVAAYVPGLVEKEKLEEALEQLLAE